MGRRAYGEDIPMSEGWYEWLWKTEPRAGKLYEVIKNVINPDDVVLDLACGAAPLAKYLNQHRYYGIDTYEKAILSLSEIYPQLTWVNADALTYDFSAIKPDVLLLLGLDNHPHADPRIIKCLQRVGNPRVILIEAAQTREGLPRDLALKNIRAFYESLRYGLIGSGEYDAELSEPLASKRVWYLLGRDYLPLDYYDGQYENDPVFCRDPVYRLRNEALVELLDQPPKRVFEFAGASGLLAEVLLEKYPHTQHYHHSDLSPRACELAFEAMVKATKETVTTVYSKPIDMVWGRPDMSRYDLVATTSMEHLPKGTDLRIIESLKSGTTVLFSLTQFPKPGHPHPFPTEKYITDRYSKLIDIECVLEYTPLQVYLLKGKKR